MDIVFDCDGTLTIDTGEYDKAPTFTPGLQLLAALANGTDHCLYLVTGRDKCPPWLKQFFLPYRIKCRDFPVQPEETYYARYFQWKIGVITELKPHLVIDDDQQICRYLNAHNVNALWTPAFAYNGRSVG